jgi:cytosine/creatinine deaminase
MSVENNNNFMQDAYEQAHKSYMEGGLPIGAVMVENNQIIGKGHNRRVQHGDPIAHGEMECFRHVGRRANYHNVTLFTTLSPCMMCAGTIVQFGIPRVVIGENKSFAGNIDFLKAHGVDVTLLNDADCEALMEKFVSENPDLWDEDIAGREHV